LKKVFSIWYKAPRINPSIDLRALDNVLSLMTSIRPDLRVLAVYRSMAFLDWGTDG
jgi:hypothetical protein